MKKIYLLIFLLVSAIGFTQDVGEYEVTTILNIKPGSGNYGGSCRNDVKVDLVYNTGNPITVINEGLVLSLGKYCLVSLVL